MPLHLFAMIIGAVLFAGPVTAWALSALPATVIPVVLVALIGLRFVLLRKPS